MHDIDALAAQIEAELQAVSQSTAELRKVRRRWSARLRSHPPEVVVALALWLFEHFRRRWIAYELVLYHPSAVRLVGPDNVERFAGQLGSWADVDQFGVLLAGPAWRAGQLGDPIIHAWARRPDPMWRRAALVATVPLNVRSQGGWGDVGRTLRVCQMLVADRDHLVSRALSWALRELIVHDRAAVEAFLAAHAAALPAHVRREVASKLNTGRKTPRATI